MKPDHSGPGWVKAVAAVVAAGVSITDLDMVEEAAEAEDAGAVGVAGSVSDPINKVRAALEAAGRRLSTPRKFFTLFGEWHAF